MRKVFQTAWVCAQVTALEASFETFMAERKAEREAIRATSKLVSPHPFGTVAFVASSSIQVQICSSGFAIMKDGLYHVCPI